MSKRTHYIYGLIDPDTGEIRYVGCSVNPEARFQDHVRTNRICNEKKWQWAKSLEARGVTAKAILLDACPDRESGRRVESDWITTLIADGLPLTNGVYKGYAGYNKGKTRGWRERQRTQT